MSEKIYREAGPEDEPAVYDLICQLENCRLDWERFGQIYRAQLEDGRYCCLVCCREGQAVGLLNLRMEDQLHHAGKVAEILEMAVAPDCRGQGIGQRLLELACRRAEAAGCMLIEAASGRPRERAHGFYRREGMIDTHLRFSKLLPESVLRTNFDE